MNSDATIDALADAIKAQTRVLIAVVGFLLLMLIVFAWDLYETRKEAERDRKRYADSQKQSRGRTGTRT